MSQASTRTWASSSRKTCLHIAFAIRSHVPRAYTVLGRGAVAHCTALGKVMLADFPFAEVRQLIETHGWRSYTPKSITTFAGLEQSLSEIRANGYAIDRGERSLETNCLAAPIRDATGRVVAAMGLALVTRQVLLTSRHFTQVDHLHGPLRTANGARGSARSRPRPPADRIARQLCTLRGPLLQWGGRYVERIRGYC